MIFANYLRQCGAYLVRSDIRYPKLNCMCTREGIFCKEAALARLLGVRRVPFHLVTLPTVKSASPLTAMSMSSANVSVRLVFAEMNAILTWQQQIKVKSKYVKW